MVLTGLRGVGKTVLLETFKPLALETGWLWVGADLSEIASVNESSMALRLLTDLSVVTSQFVISEQELRGVGFVREIKIQKRTLDFHTLNAIYQATPGLVSGKLKRVLELVWANLKVRSRKGLIFAYDEAQNISNQSAKEQFTLSFIRCFSIDSKKRRSLHVGAHGFADVIP